MLTPLIRMTLAAAVGLAAGCGDSTGAGDARDVVEFSFSGAASGSFSVEGGPHTGDPADWVLGGGAAIERFDEPASVDGEAYVWITAVRTTNGALDVLEFAAPRRVGSHAVGFGCDDPVDGLAFTRGYRSGNSESDYLDATYFFDCGTITIDEVSDRAVRGRFSGTAISYFAQPVRQIQVTAGTFRVGGPRSGALSGAMCELLGSC